MGVRRPVKWISAQSLHFACRWNELTMPKEVTMHCHGSMSAASATLGTGRLDHRSPLPSYLRMSSLPLLTPIPTPHSLGLCGLKTGLGA